MPSSALTTFFTLPDLITSLIPYLRPQDLLHLCQTTRTLHNICTPHFWKHLNLIRKKERVGTDARQVRLLMSPAGLKALGDNMENVRSVRWMTDFSWYYFNALLTYLTNNNEQANDRISTDALTHPTWGAMETPSPFPVGPLPPLLCLTSYLGLPATYVNGHESGPLTGYGQEPHHHHTFWLLRLNTSTLVRLELESLILTTYPRVIRDLCRTISGLKKLRTLRLETVRENREEGMSCQVLQSIFFSCPVSLVELVIDRTVYDDIDELQLDPQVEDWDYELGQLVLRGEDQPLCQLETLRLPEMYTGYQAPLLCKILAHCPALQSFRVPFIEDIEAARMITGTFVATCGRSITTLTIPTPIKEDQYATTLTFMDALSTQQLQVLEYFQYADRCPDKIGSWFRHSESLNSLIFTNSCHIKSNTLRTILTTFRGLERLIVTGEYCSNCCLTLEDAIAEPWACNQIQSLTLSVKLSDRGRNPTYLLQPLHAWSDKDHAHWGNLDKFYTQLGSLKELQRLDLRAAATKMIVRGPANADIVDVPYTQSCVPGLLLLQDPNPADHTKRRHGFLSKLSGLTKLRELTGSTMYESAGDKEAWRMGDREVDWFVTHLPALKRVGLIREMVWDEVPEVLQHLISRRPGVDISFVGERRQ